MAKVYRRRPYRPYRPKRKLKKRFTPRRGPKTDGSVQVKMTAITTISTQANDDAFFGVAWGSGVALNNGISCFNSTELTRYCNLYRFVQVRYMKA